MRVIPRFLDTVMKHPYIRDTYRLNTTVFRDVEPYGVLIITKLDAGFNRVELPTRMQRDFLCLETVLNGREVCLMIEG